MKLLFLAADITIPGEHVREETTHLTQREIKAELVHMLLLFAEYCDSRDIYYSLSDGTLIGAVRHRGMIPWDDDIDIYVPRPDYERLLLLEEDFYASTGLRFYSFRNRTLPFPFLKLGNPCIRAQEEILIDAYKEYLWLDIFPIDAAPDDDREFKAMIRRRKWNTSLLTLIITKSSSSSTMKAATKKALGPILRLLIDPFWLCNRIDIECSVYDFNTANTVSPIVYGYRSAGQRINRQEFMNSVDLQFEGHEFHCMSCWNSYLADQYGDYMAMPPIEERITHSLRVWRIK